MSGASAPLLPQLVQLLRRPVPPPLLQRARLHLLDWLGCAVQGYSRIGPVVSAGVRANTGLSGPCRALFCGNTHWLGALQVNAGLGNVAEMDDVHRQSTLHPGPVVIPVALAMAQSLNRPLEDALKAIVCGYETAIRLGRTLGSRHYAYFHNTSTMGTPAAAAAAAQLHGLTAEQTLWALANACSRTGGLWQMRHENVLTKQWHCIAAAIEGALAAQLAGSGMTGPQSVLEGEQGLYAAMAADARPADLLAEPGDWLIEQTSFKPWPACRHAHPTIDAARKLYRRLPAEAAVASIHISAYADALKFCDRPSPTTETEAKFSLQHCAALALSGKTPQSEDFLPDTAEFARLQPLRSATEVTQSPELTAAYPQHFGSRVQVRLRSGQSLSAQVADAWGDPQWPMSAEDIRAKAHRMMLEGGLDQPAARKLQHWALHAGDFEADLLP